MTEYEHNLVYNEGLTAHDDGVNLMDNPYDGVSQELFIEWHYGWWDGFYQEKH